MEDLRSVASWQASTIISSLTTVSRDGHQELVVDDVLLQRGRQVGDFTVLVSE